MGNVVTYDGNVDTEIEDIGIAKDSSERLGSECWTISSDMKKLKAAETWFYQQILKIPRKETLSNKHDLRKTETTRKFVHKFRKRL